MEMMNFEEWQANYFSELASKQKLTANEKLILDLHNQDSTTSVVSNALKSLLKSKYNEYKREVEYLAEKEKNKENMHNILMKLKNEKNRRNQQNRKKREHTLITIGALTDLTNFPKDRGIVTGAFLYILDKIKENPNFENQLKIRGDELLRDREMEKKK